MDSSNTPQGSTHQVSTALASALKLQLQQAGLWDALPGILSAAAHEMDTRAATLQQSPLDSSSSAAAAAATPLDATVVLGHTQSLLSLLLASMKLWDAPGFLQSPLANTAVAAVQLAAAVVQFMCTTASCATCRSSHSQKMLKSSRAMSCL